MTAFNALLVGGPREGTMLDGVEEPSAEITSILPAEDGKLYEAVYRPTDRIERDRRIYEYFGCRPVPIARNPL